MPILIRLIIVLLALAPAARAVELSLRFGALERLLGEQVFTQEGRRYVKGTKATRCNFAYLEKPRVQGLDNRLLIHARFTGRSSLNMFGGCVGLGDAFELTITAVPVFKDGNIGLTNVVVTSDGRTGFYIRRVCTAMSASLAHDFKYPVADAARKALEDPALQPAYPRELHDFHVTEIHVGNDALVLAIDFRLTVK
jgi:hypothetical protein